MIVYTSIYGGYDRLWPHADHRLVSRWICYTDNPGLQTPGWETIVEPPRYAHPCLAAKWRKCHPPECDDDGKSLWVDGSIHVDNPGYVEVIDDLLDIAPMCFVPHPDRSDIRSEAHASKVIAPHKYHQFDLRAQVDLYDARKGPTKGLWASTTFGRVHKPAVLQMGAAWMAHCELLSYQDQLSLPVLLDDYDIEPAAIPGGLLRNPLFRWRGHIR
jgi:hypothetical protein